MAKKLYIIPGHGAGDSGACGGGRTEADLVRRFAARCKAWGGRNVKRAPYKKNAYACGLITKLRLKASGWRVDEHHMDSASASAKGGHVIKDSRAKATESDKAVASLLKKKLPGRASLIVMRDDLANPKRAYAKGYEYALIEWGFITNKHDREYFIDHMDELAKEYLKARGITPLDKPKKVRCPW